MTSDEVFQFQMEGFLRARSSKHPTLIMLLDCQFHEEGNPSECCSARKSDPTSWRDKAHVEQSLSRNLYARTTTSNGLAYQAHAEWSLPKNYLEDVIRPSWSAYRAHV